MKLELVLEQADIEQAVKDFVKEKGFPIEGMYMSFDFINGRKGSGTRVVVELTTEKPETNGEFIQPEDNDENIENTIGASFGSNGSEPAFTAKPVEADTPLFTD